MGIRADPFCGRPTLLEIARSDQNREAMRRKVICDLKANTMVGAGESRSDGKRG
jgi:hypothetical protein